MGVAYIYRIPLFDAYKHSLVNPELPRARWDVAFAGAQDRTTVTTIIQYDSAQDVQKVIDMGLQAGLASTLERLDELLLTLQQ